MRELLAQWISDADALRHHEHFRTRQVPIALGALRSRADDFYISLVGELFDRMRDGYDDDTDWARLGNAIAQFAARGPEALSAIGVDAWEASLFAAAAFYCGGYPASACLTMRSADGGAERDAYLGCFDFLARPGAISSYEVRELIRAIQFGNQDIVGQVQSRIAKRVDESFADGPSEWIPERLLQVMVERFSQTNLRAVLPDGFSSFWTPLVASFLGQSTPAWDFFPSQIQAIEQGLLSSTESFSLQMPTGAGKTALCETLLFYHLKWNPVGLAVLLVPYRSLASELRGSLVKRLNQMGLLTRTVYGGTVPVGDETGVLGDLRAIVATPESLSGLLSANPDLFRRVTLLVCDEGHLLDSGSRGISLELLLARMKTRKPEPPRFIFISAIVPNIEEINSWLGGTDSSVVRSDYRPAIAEFSTLRPERSGATKVVDLEIHPHLNEPTRYRIDRFLSREDFQFVNPDTGRTNTFNFNSVKTLAIAAARKALPMGASAVFAANKRGNQGAIGLAEELLLQLENGIALPAPIDFATRERLAAANQYAIQEFGDEWIGSRILAAGSVLHHGDIPQETREVIEGLLRNKNVRLAICTSTLAEGVNLPIRTLVLYSVSRRDKDGVGSALLARDIKNLVGRAGRAGETTKGLVITANETQWTIVEPVARQALGEPVHGALQSLVTRLLDALASTQTALTNEILESSSVFYSLVDGVDATLIELAAEELGEDVLIEAAADIADQTLASSQADEDSRQVLQEVFRLRSRRIIELRTSGRLNWIRETGARVRLVNEVETGLFTSVPSWQVFTDPTDPNLVSAFVDWAMTLADMQDGLRNAFSLADEAEIDDVRELFRTFVEAWLSGSRFVEIATQLEMDVDEVLHIHASALSFTFQTIVEQGVALLGKLLETQGNKVTSAVARFPEYLRFGVPSESARILSAEGLRHRLAAVSLGRQPAVNALSDADRIQVILAAREELANREDQWRGQLGDLVYENSIQDVNSIVANQ